GEPILLNRSALLTVTRRLGSVAIMNALFDSIRRIGFRRGPDRILAGIAGGLAEVTGLNVSLMRLLALASFLLPAHGIGAYLVAWVLTPWQDGSIPLQQIFGGRLER